VDIGDLDLKGDTLLHAAASQGQKKIARDLLKRGADIHARNFAGKACYELAHEFNYWELGDYLREKAGLEKIGPSNWKVLSSCYAILSIGCQTHIFHCRAEQPESNRTSAAM